MRWLLLAGLAAAQTQCGPKYCSSSETCASVESLRGEVVFSVLCRVSVAMSTVFVHCAWLAAVRQRIRRRCAKVFGSLCTVIASLCR